MRRTRYIIRAILLLWTILWFAYLNIKTTDNIGLVAEFKFETFDNLMGNIKSDTLYREQKLDVLDNKTTRFTGQILEDSSDVREGILYLMGTLALFIVIEVTFSIGDRKKRQTTNI